jgi:hypothetical protein
MNWRLEPWENGIAAQEAWSERCDQARSVSGAERLRAVYEWMRAARDGPFPDPGRDPLLSAQPLLPGMQLVAQLYSEAHEPESPLPIVEPAPEGFVTVFAREPRREIEDLAVSARRCCAAACAAYEDAPESFAAALHFAWRALCVGLRAEWHILEVTAPVLDTGRRVRGPKDDLRKGPPAAQLEAELRAYHQNHPRVSWTAACQRIGETHGIAGETVKRKTRDALRW